VEHDAAMTNSHRRIVVVGYDGSPASRAALACAADRAAPDGIVVAVHCYDAPVTLNPARHAGEYQRALKVAEEEGGALLGALPASYDGVAVEKELVSGPAPRVLANIATERGATEVIIGTRGFGRVRALLGSVAHELIHIAEWPVTVIPERALKEGEVEAAR
jgi:nucleotide-binding universal stress UspA family protein